MKAIAKIGLGVLGTVGGVVLGCLTGEAIDRIEARRGYRYTGEEVKSGTETEEASVSEEVSVDDEVEEESTDEGDTTEEPVNETLEAEGSTDSEGDVSDDHNDTEPEVDDSVDGQDVEEDDSIPESVTPLVDNVRKMAKEIAENEEFPDRRDEAEEVIQADVFIIPNKCYPIDEEPFFTEEIIRNQYGLFGANGIKPSGRELMLEAWITANDGTPFKCDNLCDHVWKHDGYRCTLSYDRNVPASLFKDKKEGDIVSVVLPVDRAPIDRNDPEKKKDTVWVKFELKCAQNDHRYARCGNFEHIFEKVTE